jgi:hypothetical protein
MLDALCDDQAGLDAVADALAPRLEARIATSGQEEDRRWAQ